MRAATIGSGSAKPPTSAHGVRGSHSDAMQEIRLFMQQSERGFNASSHLQDYNPAAFPPTNRWLFRGGSLLYTQ